jgi:hypothetical protein
MPPDMFPRMKMSLATVPDVGNGSDLDEHVVGNFQDVVDGLIPDLFIWEKMSPATRSPGGPGSVPTWMNMSSGTSSMSSMTDLGCPGTVLT